MAFGRRISEEESHSSCRSKINLTAGDCFASICSMRALYKITIFVLIPTMLSAAAFLCCCERLAFADSCHTSTPALRHCHPSVSSTHDREGSWPAWTASHQCDCEKIVSDRGSLRLGISLPVPFHGLQKSFVIARLISPILAFFSSSPLYGPPDQKPSSIPFYLQFLNLRIYPSFKNHPLSFLLKGSFVFVCLFFENNIVLGGGEP